MSHTLPSAATAASWTLAADGITWFLPVAADEAPGGDPVGNWHFAGGTGWNAGTPSEEIMLEAGGGISDEIFMDNKGPGGSAEITFISDPVPEPASIFLFGSCLLGMAIAAARKHRKTV